MKIYGGKAPFPFMKSHVRQIRPIWVMEELGQPYDVELLDLAKGEEAAPEYLTLNPFGRVPALEDGSVRLFESGAICAYLADKFGKLIPKAGTPERARHDQWVFTAVTMVEPHTLRLVAADFFYKDEPEAPVMRSLAYESLEGTLPPLESVLLQKTYLNGDRFTVADIMMTACLRFAAHTDLYSKYPAITAYLNRNTERPAFQRAAAKQ
jgi:glutathione S-transferase